MEMIKIDVYCTLCRQYWTDQRLSFNSNVIDELTMNWQVESKTSQSVLLVAVYIQQLDFMSLHMKTSLYYIAVPLQDLDARHLFSEWEGLLPAQDCSSQ